MTREWYYQLMGETIGPLSDAEIYQHAQEGRILPDTYVRIGADGDWINADVVEGLFESYPPMPSQSNVVASSNVDNEQPQESEFTDDGSASALEAGPDPGSIDASNSKVRLNWLVAMGVLVAVPFVVVLIEKSGSRSQVGISKSEYSYSSVTSNESATVAENVATGSGGVTEGSDSNEMLRVQARIESLRFEITQMREEERSREREIADIEDRARAARRPDLTGLRKTIDLQDFRARIRRKSEELLRAERRLHEILSK